MLVGKPTEGEAEVWQAKLFAYLVQIWCKKVQTKVKSRAKMVNTAFDHEFTTPYKPVYKCGIYHLCL